MHVVCYPKDGGFDYVISDWQILTYIVLNACLECMCLCGPEAMIQSISSAPRCPEIHYFVFRCFLVAMELLRG